MKWSYCFLPLLAVFGMLAAEEPDFESSEPLEAKALSPDTRQYVRAGVVTPFIFPFPTVGYGVRSSYGIHAIDLSLNYTNALVEAHALGARIAYILYMGKPSAGMTPYVGPAISAGVMTIPLTEENTYPVPYVNAEVFVGGEFRAKKSDKRFFAQLGVSPGTIAFTGWPGFSLGMGVSL